MMNRGIPNYCDSIDSMAGLKTAYVNVCKCFPLVEMKTGSKEIDPFSTAQSKSAQIVQFWKIVPIWYVLALINPRLLRFEYWNLTSHEW